MKPNAERTAVAVLSGALLLLTGCPSAYQRTYQQETQRLEMQQRAADAEAQAAHAQASKYAAVCYFAVGSAALDEDTLRQLRWFVQQMQPYPQAMVQVQGFTDSTGSEATNTGLSLERATNVSSYLTSQGIAASRIVTQGFGANYAAASNESGQGRRNNRRVEVTVR
jgi:outer membrane protein OmpA-like peptidoglycan-associated protein